MELIPLPVLVAAVSGVPEVRLAVLFGSQARREEDPDDVDLLFELTDSSPETMTRLHEHLQRTLRLVDWQVDPTTLKVFAHSRDAWFKVVRDGVVLLDREGHWPLIVADPEGERLAAFIPLDQLPPHERKAADYIIEHSDGG